MRQLASWRTMLQVMATLCCCFIQPACRHMSLLRAYERAARTIASIAFVALFAHIYPSTCSTSTCRTGIMESCPRLHVWPQSPIVYKKCMLCSLEDVMWPNITEQRAEVQARHVDDFYLYHMVMFEMDSREFNARARPCRNSYSVQPSPLIPRRLSCSAAQQRVL